MKKTLPKISIIIPCYNSEKTLNEAVESCYRQNLKDEFEIIMIDDGSTDDTKNLMRKLASKHSNIKLLFNEKNQGGGAARNKAIAHSEGQLVFCLDSDNFLGDDCLQKMMKFLDQTKLDGVVIHHQRFFHEKNSRSFEVLTNKILEKPIKITDLYDGSGTMVDNFLMTKKSYLQSGGYPEHHDFDTQGFEIRYLSRGNKIMVAPDTLAYHRMTPKNPSYFERAYNNGNFSLNYYLIFEEIFSQLSEKAQKTLIDYDIFKNSSTSKSLINEIKQLVGEGELFGEGYQSPQTKNYGEAIKNYKSGKYPEALKVLEMMIAAGEESKIVYYTALRSLVALSKIDRPKIEKETMKLVEGLTLEKQALYKKYHKIPGVLPLAVLAGKIKNKWRNKSSKR